VDIRSNLNNQSGEQMKLYPYAKDLFYHPSGILSMTIQIYDDMNTQEFSFGFQPAGNLKMFLEQIYEDENGL
jgi:hypothetical protein